MRVKTVVILQYVAAILAMAAMVASGALDWDLPEGLWALLGGVAGLMLKRPSDTSTMRKALPEG